MKLQDQDIINNGFTFNYEDGSGHRIFSKPIDGTNGQRVRHLILYPKISWVVILDGDDGLLFADCNKRLWGKIISSHDLSIALSTLK